MQPRNLNSSLKGQDSEQPQDRLQPKAQPHLQPQAPPQLQPQPQSHHESLELEGSPLSLSQSQHDLSQSAFLSWLSQTQSHGSLLSSSVLTPDSSPGKLDPAPSQPMEEPNEAESGLDPPASWFNFSAQVPCNAAPTPPPAVSEDQPTPSPQLPASKPVSCRKNMFLMFAQAPWVGYGTAKETYMCENTLILLCLLLVTDE